MNSKLVLCVSIIIIITTLTRNEEEEGMQLQNKASSTCCPYSFGCVFMTEITKANGIGYKFILVIIPTTTATIIIIKNF